MNAITLSQLFLLGLCMLLGMYGTYLLAMFMQFRRAASTERRYYQLKIDQLESDAKEKLDAQATEFAGDNPGAVDGDDGSGEAFTVNVAEFVRICAGDPPTVDEGAEGRHQAQGQPDIHGHLS